MGYLGVEPIIDSILAQLQANLPAKLLALQPTFNPALAMPDVAEFTFGERQIHALYPAIEAFPVTTPIDKDNVATMTFRHNVGIALFVRDAKEENLTRLLLRYARAVIEVLADARIAGAFGTVSLDLNEQVLDWSPTRVMPRALFERDVMFAIRATKGESRT